MKSGNECAQCGANLIEPEWSEHFPDHRIRNVWSCGACGYQFEDTVYLPPPRELADAEYRSAVIPYAPKGRSGGSEADLLDRTYE